MEQFLAYDFDADEDFAQGLQTILSRSGHNQSDRDQMILRAKLFFFEKKTGIHITPQEHQDYLQSLNTTSSLTEKKEEPAAELSFAEIKHLIETGQAHLIPNNKAIPEQLNDAPPSASAAKARRKPWEVAQDEVVEGSQAI